MSRNYSIVEPHPTVPSSGAFFGRGGAGNVKKIKPEEVTAGPNATGPASRTTLSRPAQNGSKFVRCGRGGAGNYATTSTAADDSSIFQFDEEMIKKRDARPAPVYHVGRGGAGNLFYERPVASERKDSTSSEDSERVTALRRNSGGVLSIFSRRSA